MYPAVATLPKVQHDGSNHPQIEEESIIDDNTGYVEAELKVYKGAKKKKVQAEERRNLFEDLFEKDVMTNITRRLVEKHEAKLKRKAHRNDHIEHVRFLNSGKMKDAQSEARKMKKKEEDPEKTLALR